ncbi:MAG: YggS family pyridoxal phosphate-dependent enzyme [Planctomycetota bacterium]
MPTRTPSPDAMDLRDTYRRVSDQIAEAAIRSGRQPSDVLMVAVTKYASVDQIQRIVEMGHVDLGESRVQQLSQRVPQIDEFLARRKTLAGAIPKSSEAVPDRVRWHMIGHLQRNKVKQVSPLVDLIHSVDSLRLAEELHNYAARKDVILDVLLQVNASGEGSKSGVVAPAVLPLAEQLDTMVHLRLRGFMTMAPYSDNPEDARPTFARTADLFNDAKKAKLGGEHLTVLSMGMSGDFEVAIEEGANLVRVGRGLFGDQEAL